MIPTIPWISPGVLISLMAAVLGSGSGTVQREVTVEWRQVHPLPSGGRVSLENVSGTVWISGWDQDEVSLEVVKRASDPVLLEGVEVEVSATPERLAIRTRYPGGAGRRPTHVPEVDYTLRVPFRTILEGVFLGTGTLTVIEVAGGVCATTVNGSVTVERSSGDLKLRCINGRTVARLTSLTRPQSVELETVNGSTTVILPAHAAADVFAHVLNGQISTDFPLLVLPDYPAGTKAEGRLGDGGVQVTARTVNGLVRIGRSP